MISHMTQKSIPDISIILTFQGVTKTIVWHFQIHVLRMFDWFRSQKVPPVSLPLSDFSASAGHFGGIGPSAIEVSYRPVDCFQGLSPLRRRSIVFHSYQEFVLVRFFPFGPQTRAEIHAFNSSCQNIMPMNLPYMSILVSSIDALAGWSITKDSLTIQNTMFIEFGPVSDSCPIEIKPFSYEITTFFGWPQLRSGPPSVLGLQTDLAIWWSLLPHFQF